ESPGGRIGHGADAPRQPATSRQRPRLHVDRVGARLGVKPTPLGGIVDDARCAENGPGAGACDAEWPALPKRRTGLVDHARGVDEGPDGKVVAQRPGDAERDEPSLRNSVSSTEPDPHRRPEPACQPLLDRHRAGKRQPVNVHATLLMLSLKLPAASKAADGSKPEWIAQCSQRASLPGPYSSHSMPSSRAA